MAIITKTQWGRALEPAETTSINEYVSTQQAAGTTDGIRYQSFYTEEQNVPEADLVSVRIWNTNESANAFLTYIATYSPAPVMSEIL